MRRYYFSLILIVSHLSGCGTMNSNFSCQATAGDSCLTIEQVDAMTRFADDVKPYPLANGFLKANEERQKPKGRIIKQSNGQMVWVRQNAGDNSWA